MKKLVSTLLATTFLTFAMNGVVHADDNRGGDKPKHCMKSGHKGHHGMGMQGHGKPPFLHGIALTNEQDDKIFALTHAEAPKMRDHFKQRHQVKQELMQLSHAPTFDEGKANQLADKLASLTREGAINHARLDSKVFALLTPEQREQALKNKARFKEGRGGHLPTGAHSKRHREHHVKG
jgi:periplasmic protein CpxP/Spy